MKMMSLLWFGLGCFLCGLSFLSGPYLYAAIFSLPCFAMSWFTRRFSIRTLSRASVSEWNDSSRKTSVIGTQPDQKETGAVALKEKRRKSLSELEENMDRSLLDALSVLRQAVSAHTLGVFFPDGGSGMYLRVWITEGDSIIPGANIQPGHGLAGLLLKEGVRRVLEHDITTPSTQFHYYSQDEKVRSIAGVPIIVEGVRRGAVVIDSLKASAFGIDTVSLLENFSSLVGRFVYYAYMNFDNANRRDQLLALTEYQRKFLDKMSEKDIVSHIQQYVEQSLEVDRLMIIAREKADPGRARVVFCSGPDEGFFQDFQFSLSERGLVGLVFQKAQVINRRFTRGEKIPRLCEQERYNEAFRCLLAVPVYTDGVTHVLLVESIKRPWFTDSQKELLLTISRAAGFALSKTRLYKEKEQLSRRDGLTGLINHKTFQEQYKTELLRSQRMNYSLTILMLDLDHFKNVNDTYGHPVGDIVLKSVSKIIEQFVREGNDTVARYGGEEFVCLLVNSDTNASRETAERIRQAVAEKEFEIGAPQKLKATLSIGGAVYPQDSRKGEDILDRADKALYHAKKNGRNRVVFYSD